MKINDFRRRNQARKEKKDFGRRSIKRTACEDSIITSVTLGGQPAKTFIITSVMLRGPPAKTFFSKQRRKKNRSKSQLQIHKIVGLDHKLKIPRAHAPNQAIKYFIHNTDSHIQIPQANATNPQYKFKAANAQQIHSTNQAANAPNQAINSQMQDVLDGER